MHQRCDYANECPWGSKTKPGTCGFTSCQRDELLNRAKRGDVHAWRSLVDRGELPQHGKLDKYDGHKWYW